MPSATESGGTSPEFVRSQCATTLGIVENAQLASTAQELIRLVGRRSVYSRASLEEMNPSPGSPVLVVDFLLTGHLAPPVTLTSLIEQQALRGSAPQSIKRLESDTYERIRPLLQVGYE
jgi:hypothetical protein